MTNTVESTLQKIGLTLPSAVAPAGSYVPTVRTGDMLYISGQLPFVDGVVQHQGTVGTDVTVEEAVNAARLCGVQILAQAKAALGDLDRVARVVKLVGFVKSTPDFTAQPTVINGASDLMVAVFGDQGRHARSAVGVSSLPLGAAVEVEAILEIATG